MKHFSLDIETLSSDPTSAILSIGLYEIEGFETEPNPDNLFYANVSLQSSIDLGLSISGKTFQWWMEQSDIARKGLFNPSPISIEEMSESLYGWWNARLSVPNRVWCHATFDFPILHNAFALLKYSAPPWHYTSCRDLRTLLDGIDYPDLKRGARKEHNAGWDAFAQGQSVVYALEGRRSQV